jgi:hypothetical protein
MYQIFSMFNLLCMHRAKFLSKYFRSNEIKSKVHVSSINFMLEDEHRLSLGILMHINTYIIFVVYCTKILILLQLYYIYWV